jgi:hypothetical protein
MTYEYSGYLSTILKAPDPAVRDSLPAIRFTGDDLKKWGRKDLPWDPEWQHIPAACKRAGTGVRIEGHFEEVRQIDNLTVDDPSFWVAISSLDWADPRFPVDTAAYPIIETTYRCTSPNAHPAWQWTYPGGMHFDWLRPTQEWRTIARCVPYFGFPPRVDALILRLYSSARKSVSFEVESVRFRAMSAAEAEAYHGACAALKQERIPKRYPILDEFLPLGCFMDAGSSKRLAAMLGISLDEYWALTLEDIARHYHNCIALENIDRLNPEEWREVLGLGEYYGVKFVAIHNLPVGSPRPYCREYIENHVRPYANSPALLAWGLYDEPPERAFPEILEANALIEQADPNHPLVVLHRDPNAVALFAPFLPVSGVAHYGSHVPWHIGEMIQAHLPLSGGQQFWVVAPGFVYATDTPEWHSCPEMRIMMNRALASGARGWFTFAYHNDPIWIRGSCQRSLTGPFLTFSDLWSELGQRLEHGNAIAPLFLKSSPEKTLGDWFAYDSEAHVNTQLPKGIEPVSVTRLCGADYELYCLVSNDVREMTTVHIDINPQGIRGRAVYDASDYVRTRKWSPMDSKRHLEMFPGQLHAVLVAKPEVCAHWRSVIAERLMENGRRCLSFDLALVRSYGINISDIEEILDGMNGFAGAMNIEPMQRARDMLLNRLYDSPVIYEARSKIIEASAAICACDGSLCRLLGRGKVDQARQLGFKVLPLAREFTNLRLELRRGKGAAILQQCEGLAQRAIELLAEIRSIS